MKIAIACSPGGHLKELYSLVHQIEKNKNNKIIFFTFKFPGIEKSLKDYEVYYTINPARNPIKYFKSTLDSLFFLIKKKPKVIISTGGGFVIPLYWFGKLLGKKLIFIETSSRITETSVTGKMVYPIADLLCKFRYP